MKIMKSKALIAMAVAGAFWSTGSIADQSYPMDAHEVPPALSTILSLDNQTGGYQGWGPMANLQTPSAADDSKPLAQIDKEREYKQHLAEVKSVREQVWVANAPLRSEYENVGATRSRGTGFGRFFSR